MSDNITAEQARNILDANTRRVDYLTVHRALETVIAQAAEIERLKTALTDHLRQEADGWVDAA